MTTHVLLEISGGVLGNIIVSGQLGTIYVWLRDYDDLESQGITRELSETIFPTLVYGDKGILPPKHFTRDISE